MNISEFGSTVSSLSAFNNEAKEMKDISGTKDKKLDKDKSLEADDIGVIDHSDQVENSCSVVFGRVRNCKIGVDYKAKGGHFDCGKHDFSEMSCTSYFELPRQSSINPRIFFSLKVMMAI